MLGERQEQQQQQEAKPGIICPNCDCRHVPVYYTRQRAGFIVRVRFCRNCGRRLVTRERIIASD